MSTIKISSSFFGSSKSKEKANELKLEGNTHYKYKRYHSAVKSYTQAMFQSPWPLPQVLRQLDECIAGLEIRIRSILYDDLPQLKEATEPYNSLPSMLAQCYGNRSAALYELGQYEAVVTDINRALYAGYKKPQVFKLYKRKAISLAQIGKIKSARRVVEKYKKEIDEEDSGLSEADKEKCEKDIVIINTEIMLSEQKQIVPTEKLKDEPVETFVSDQVKIEKSPKVGRHVIADKEVSKGTCVVHEAAYASILSTEYMFSHCAKCFKECLILIPCVLCINAGYCSYPCMYDSWTYHWQECKNAKEWAWMPWISQLALRMLFFTPKPVVISLIKEGRSSHSIDTAIEKAKKGFIAVPEKLLPVLNLVAHRGKYTDEEQRQLIEKDALRAVDYFRQHILRYFDLRECQSRTLYELLRYYMCQLRFNTSAITVNALATMEDEGEGYNVRDVVKQKLGFAVFLSASLFNHSCDPNVFFRFEGNCVRVIAQSEIPAGVELTHCYGPQVSKQKKADRHTILKRGYMFTCNCKVCFNPDNDMIFKEYAWDALCCPECRGILPVLPDNYRTNCLKCGEVFPLRKYFDQRENARKIYEEAVKDNSLDKLLECEKMQREVLYCGNLELAKTRDTLAHYYVNEGNSDKALDFLIDSYAAVKEIFGAASIEVSEELSKLTQLLFKSGRIQDALTTAQRTIPLLELFYGPKHVDVIQLKSMIDTLDTMNKVD